MNIKHPILSLFTLTVFSACSDQKLDDPSISKIESELATNNVEKGDRDENLISLDLRRPADNLYAWRKTRASLDPQ